MEMEKVRKGKRKQKTKKQSITWKKKSSKEMSTIGIWELRMHYQSRCKTSSLKAIFAHHSLSNPTPTPSPKIN